MVIEKTVPILMKNQMVATKWGNKTGEKYEVGKTYEIEIKYLSRYSSELVTAKCAACGKTERMSFNRSVGWTCSNCSVKKIKHLGRNFR